jgi:hypothetical protein
VDDDGQDDSGGGGKGVLLAVAVLLLWLAGVCFWLAFEGTSFLPDKLPVDKSGKQSYFLGILQALAKRAQVLQARGVASEQSATDQSGG